MISRFSGIDRAVLGGGPLIWPARKRLGTRRPTRPRPSGPGQAATQATASRAKRLTTSILDAIGQPGLASLALSAAAAPAGRDETGDVAAQTGDLLDQARGDGLVARIGHQEDGLDLALQLLVHRRHLEFVLEVGHGPQAPDDDRWPRLPRRNASAGSRTAAPRSRPGRPKRAVSSTHACRPALRARTAAPCHGFMATPMTS